MSCHVFLTRKYEQEWVNPSNAGATFIQSTHTVAKIFDNHLNPVMLVFIGKLSLSTFR